MSIFYYKSISYTTVRIIGNILDYLCVQQVYNHEQMNAVKLPILAILADFSAGSRSSLFESGAAPMHRLGVRFLSHAHNFGELISRKFSRALPERGIPVSFGGDREHCFES